MLLWEKKRMTLLKQTIYIDKVSKLLQKTDPVQETLCWCLQEQNRFVKHIPHYKLLHYVYPIILNAYFTIQERVTKVIHLIYSHNLTIEYCYD